MHHLYHRRWLITIKLEITHPFHLWLIQKQPKNILWKIDQTYYIGKYHGIELFKIIRLMHQFHIPYKFVIKRVN